MNGFPAQGSNQIIMRSNGFFIIFRLLRFMPYIAGVLLIAAIAIWVIFGIKKFRWAKILAIVLTVLVVITGLCSLGTLFLGRFRGGFPPNTEQFQRFEERRDSGAEKGVNDNIINSMEAVI
jgi:Mn2+/Fe2+ NRAMP family transporter